MSLSAQVMRVGGPGAQPSNGRPEHTTKKKQEKKKKKKKLEARNR